MFAVVVGVSGSGKSEYAENRAVRLAEGGKLYYAAAMEPYGRDAEARIERHRRLRSGKGFRTLECYRNIEELVGMIGPKECREATILLECMSNLLANEMFSPDARLSCAGSDRCPMESEAGTQPEKTGADVVEKILSGISVLVRQTKNLIVVTNDVFADGCTYDKETQDYIKNLGAIIRRLAEAADEAVEVVYTIPMKIV